MNRVIVVAAALSALSSLAHSEVSYQFDLSALQITTIDLKPQDNVQPSYQLMLDNGSTWINVWKPLVAYPWDIENITLDGGFAPFSLHYSGQGWKSDLETGPSGTQASFYSQGEGIQSNLVINTEYHIRVAPHTGLNLLHPLSVQAQSAPCITQQSCYYYGMADIRVNMSGTWTSGSWQSDLSASSYTKAVTAEYGAPASYVGSAAMSAFNFTDQEQDLVIHWSTYASAIPEPSALGLFGSAAALIALVARKRKTLT